MHFGTDHREYDYKQRTMKMECIQEIYNFYFQSGLWSPEIKFELDDMDFKIPGTDEDSDEESSKSESKQSTDDSSDDDDDDDGDNDSDGGIVDSTNNGAGTRKRKRSV